MADVTFSLVEHPWLFVLVFLLTFLVVNILAIIVLVAVLKLPRDAPTTGTWAGILTYGLMIFLLVPFVMGFYDQSSPYSDYLKEIYLIPMKPLLYLILLGVSCYLFLALSQMAGTLVYRLSQGQPVDRAFFRANFPFRSELPPHSASWFVSTTSIFEEIAYRGVVMAMFLRFYDQPKAILFSALAFGAMHLFNLLSGRAPVFLVGQAVWAAILGLFYGYVTLTSGNLLPAMIVHYLGNLFVHPFIAYIQNNASMRVQALYGVIFSAGVIPTVLMSIWVLVFTTLWPLPSTT